MRLLLLHGEAIASSRKKLLEIKQKFDSNNVVVFEKGVEVSDVSGTLQTVSIFEEERLIILENPPDDFVFDPSPLIYHLVLWFDHEVPEKKPVMEWVKKEGQILYFPEAKKTTIFSFLNKLGMKDKGAFIELNKLKKEGLDTQYIIIMIFYLLRNLVVSPKGAKEFIKNKNAGMRKNFSPDELINLYKEVLEIDFKIKSGLLEKDQAQFSLINLFCHKV